MFSKVKEGKIYRIEKDGKPTRFTVFKGHAPKFKERQYWWIALDDNSLIEIDRLDDAVDTISTLYVALNQ